MKNKKILFGLFVIAILITGLFIYLQKRNEQSLSSEELVRYESVYHEYPVIFLRNALDAYVGALDGKVANESCLMPLAIDPKSEELEEGIVITSGLASFDRKYFESKFVVWTYDNNEIEGNDIQILFKNKPDRIFYAWVGHDKEGEICLLGFNSTDNDPKILKEEIKSMKPYIQDYGI